MDTMAAAFDPAAAKRLRTGDPVWWKQLLDVQRPYRWHIQRLELGFMLDVGCGFGRNLIHHGGNGIGIDINPARLARCREAGLTVFTPEEFASSPYGSGAQFDTLLFSHVLEHMREADARALVGKYVPRLKAGGRAVFITPQEAGFRSDDTHVEFVDIAKLRDFASSVGLAAEKDYSFPLPRAAGRWFRYNEFVVIARKRA
jgi:SAM-dependent methyltransferase